jgi:glycogen(starch) synthase
MDIWNVSHSKGVNKALWRALLKSVDAVVTCSHSLKDEVARFLADCKTTIVTVHNGIDPKIVAEEKKEKFVLPPQLANGRFILNIGTFEHKKGQDILLAAFELVADKFPDVMLVLIGSSGETGESIRKTVCGMKSGQRVRMYENVPRNRIWTFLQGATILAMPSRREPFGIAILEAGLLRKPVVAARVGGIPEIITANETGRLVETEDAKALADEITYLLEHPEERQRLGAALAERVEQDFTWTRAYESYMKLVLQVSTTSP